MRLADYPDISGMATGNRQMPGDSLMRSRLRPSLLCEGRLLLKMGIGKPLIARMMLLAEDHGTTVEEELLACGEIEEPLYFEALAQMLDLPFLGTIDADRVQDLAGIDSQLKRPEMLRLHYPLRPPVTVIVPRIDRLDEIAERLRCNPALRACLAISPPSAVRRAVWQAGSVRRVSAAVRTLFETVPLHSARITFWGKQGFYAGVGLCSLLACAVALPLQSIVVLHVVLTLFYLAHFLVRLVALFHAFASRPGPKDATASAFPPSAGRALPETALPETALPETDRTPLPVYSVLVALYKETSVVEQLVKALDRLDWPRSRLDIKLVCEEDDEDTRAAVAALKLGQEYEIVAVPLHLPRSKPKALTYALAGVRGRFVTVYDAEDRPAPGQLREAYAAFLRAPAHVACLQAPLVVTNAGQSWLSALFALEYAALFRGLLPMLSATGLPLPLGGTSNHFRKEALVRVGGWDPYNMTEDADLGMRLHRLGYRSQVLWRPTLEDAPVTVPVWLGQRTRWFKGWLQTWLVLMREPVRLRREIGWSGFAVFQILVAGMLLSSLSHPVILGFLVYATALMLQERAHGEGQLAFWLFVIDLVNIFGSYAIFIALGRNPMSAKEKRGVGWRWMLVPAYWILMSVAAWMALIELRTKPFSWNKTPHIPTSA